MNKLAETATRLEQKQFHSPGEERLLLRQMLEQKLRVHQIMHVERQMQMLLTFLENLRVLHGGILAIDSKYVCSDPFFAATVTDVLSLGHAAARNSAVQLSKTV